MKKFRLIRKIVVGQHSLIRTSHSSKTQNQLVKSSACLSFLLIICMSRLYCLLTMNLHQSLTDFLFPFNIQLFLIEDDYIQLREGAQKMVAATAAVAKVAAAAAASTPYSSYMSTVAVTPMAQSHRMKKVPSIDSKNIKSDKALEEYAVISSNLGDDPLKLSVMQHQQSNGPSYSVAGGLSNVKILSKSKDSREMDGPESRVVQSVGNGGSAQISGSANGRLVSSFTSKHQTRYMTLDWPLNHNMA